MYFLTFGGSALLHLLAAYPRVVALFGIAATVALLATPHGPGRYIGTKSHLARIEAAIRSQEAAAAGHEAEAERAAERLLEEQSDSEIAEAIEYTLRRCGSGCTDLSTPMVSRDPALRKRVLVLYELDRAARPSSTPLTENGHSGTK